MNYKPVSLVYVLCRSMFLTAFVSAVCSLPVYLITNKIGGTVATFCTVTVCQIALSSLFSILKTNKDNKAEFLAKQVLKEASQRRMPFNVSCAYCGESNMIGISFTEDNSFVCAKCNSPNKVYIQFSTVRVTTPLIGKQDAVTAKDLLEDDDKSVTESTINKPVQIGGV